MKDEKEFEYPSPDKSPEENAFLEKALHRELDKAFTDSILGPKGSFDAMAAAERNLKKEKKD